jgi:hypothetical protein
MISVGTDADDLAVKNLLSQSTSMSMDIGATIDINVNSMVDFTSSSITGNDYTTIANRQPFKKLFPLDTIVKPLRPVSAGIKYGVSGDVAQYTYADPTTVTYTPDAQKTNTIKYRTYYPGSDTYYKYWLSPKDQNASLAITYPKTVYANKIIITFEISHSMPSAWSITVGSSTISGTSADIKNFNSTKFDAGQLALYYNGTTWSKNASDINLNSYASFTTMSMTATNPGGYIGVIEFAPHWVRDLTPYVVDFNLRKESSASTEALIPVGNITANSLSMMLNNYNGNQSSGSIYFETYLKSTTIDITKMYLYKQAQINLYIKLYNSGGGYSDSKGSYYKINQGTFYLDSWDIAEYGDVTLNGLDGAKILQETLAPDIFCDGYSSVAIIRRLLDAVGFTNYSFNYNTNDQSIISPNYWWTDATMTVWDNLQNLCRDSQMSAVMDENNVLQFYTRDFIYDATKSVNYQFRNSFSGSDLSNIISLVKKDLPSVNQVKIIYYSAVSSAYDQSSAPLWSSGQSFLAAAALVENILTSDVPSIGVKKYLHLNPIVINDLNAEQIVYSYNGFFMVGSEIIEYDAIEYQYTDINTLDSKTIDVTGESDLLKYRGQAKINATPGNNLYQTTFTPTGRYRIKTRGAFGTKIENHYVNAKNDSDGWSGYKGVVWK